MTTEPKNPNPGLLRKPTDEELASIGARPSGEQRDPAADPDCPRCGGAGFVETPDRLRGGHVCSCTFERRPAAAADDAASYVDQRNAEMTTETNNATPANDDALVRPGAACPQCGERRARALRRIDHPDCGAGFSCESCGASYGPVRHPDDAASYVDQRNAELTRIALEALELETLEARGRDALDFHDLPVWGIKRALEAAYEAGRRSAGG